MKLARIEITNFRCFESLVVSLHPDVNVFVGVNGAGKTALLDAIAIALFDIVAANSSVTNRAHASQRVDLRPTDILIDPEAADKINGRRGFVQFRAQASSYYALADFPAKTSSGQSQMLEWDSYIQFQSPSRFSYDNRNSERLSQIYRYFEALWREIRASDPKALIPLPVVAYYRADRHLAGMPALGDIFATTLERTDAYQGALNAGANFQAMLRWFYLRENEELRQARRLQEDITFEFHDLKAVRVALQSVLNGVKEIFFDENKLKVRIANGQQTSKDFELEQLSDGYRMLLAVVLDFARRLAQANPAWKNPLEAPGILLIDELELHLHPTWQQQIIPNLRRVFPNTQLIVSTHSPQVLTTVDREQIRILKDRMLHAPSASTYGAESSRVMLEVMGAENRPPNNENVDQLHILFQLINQGKLEDAEAMCEELISQWGSSDPVLIEAQAAIKNRQWEKELGL